MEYTLRNTISKYQKLLSRRRVAWPFEAVSPGKHNCPSRGLNEIRLGEYFLEDHEKILLTRKLGQSKCRRYRGLVGRRMHW